MSRQEREKWDRIHRERGDDSGVPSPWVVSRCAVLPDGGRALDLAGGAGRHALWLAERGWSVTLCDISAVALATARRNAARRGLILDTALVDLDDADPPAGPWDLVLSYHYLNRRLFPLFPRLLAPEGVLLFAQPTLRNLERHERPGRRHLLSPQEILTLLGDLEVVWYEEDWGEEGRHEARVVARPGPAT